MYVRTVDVLHNRRKVKSKLEIFPKEATAFTACINRHIILHRTIWNWLCVLIKSKLVVLGTVNNTTINDHECQHVTERTDLFVIFWASMTGGQNLLSCIPKWTLENLIKKQFKYVVNRTTQYTEEKINGRICAAHLLTSQFNNLLSYVLTWSAMHNEAKYDWLKPIDQCIPSSLWSRFLGQDKPCKQFIDFHSRALMRTSNVAWLLIRSSLEVQSLFPLSRLKAFAKFAIFLQRYNAAC